MRCQPLLVVAVFAALKASEIAGLHQALARITFFLRKNFAACHLLRAGIIRLGFGLVGKAA